MKSPSEQSSSKATRQKNQTSDNTKEASVPIKRDVFKLNNALSETTLFDIPNTKDESLDTPSSNDVSQKPDFSKDTNVSRQKTERTSPMEGIKNDFKESTLSPQLLKRIANAAAKLGINSEELVSSMLDAQFAEPKRWTDDLEEPTKPWKESEFCRFEEIVGESFIFQFRNRTALNTELQDRILTNNGMLEVMDTVDNIDELQKRIELITVQNGDPDESRKALQYKRDLDSKNYPSTEHHL